MTHQVVNADCRKYLTGAFCPQGFDLIFADPPFGIDQPYQGFNDKIEHYDDFTKSWILLCWSKLNAGAALVLHGSVAVSREFLAVLRSEGLDHYIEAELVWAFNFGQCKFNNFIDTHTKAIVVRKPSSKENRKFYVENVLTPSKRLLLGDKRVETSRYKGYVPFGTVWGLDSDDGVVTEPLTAEPNWGRVQGNNKERRQGHPNQLPERYIKRIIKAYSQEGDLVFDPFGGSGTTITVAKHLNRSCITTDISTWNCESIKSRLEEGVKL